MDKILMRAFVPEIRKKNTDTRTVTFVASDGSRDSAHTVLNQAGWDLKRFNANPVIGYNHEVYGAWDTKDVDFVIGKGRAYVEDGKLLVDITFEPKEFNELAEKVYQKVLFGSLNAVSVGFLPKGQGRWGDGEEARGEANETYYYAGQELLEISVVNIPANANATRKGEDLAAEELAALYAEDDAKKKAEQEPEPEPEPEEKGVDAESVLREADLILAASAAIV
ncbi:MAG: HK97 family phage prohead protease [Bacteroidales bacterium]|nr:HK97 family phage prohead protease [Bacteroidales bacterium]